MDAKDIALQRSCVDLLDITAALSNVLRTVVFLNSSSLDDHSSNVVDRCTLECVELAMDILQYNMTNFLASMSLSFHESTGISVQRSNGIQ